MDTENNEEARKKEIIDDKSESTLKIEDHLQAINYSLSKELNFIAYLVAVA